MPSVGVLEQIVDLGRWAPSGDNTQPWRFEVAGDDRLVVHGFDTREHCLYDLDGRASQMSLGALIETIVIAASAHSLAVEITRRTAMDDAHPTFDIAFAHDAFVQRDPLVDVITTRSVQRRPLSTRQLTQEHRTLLEEAVGDGHVLRWADAWPQRWSMARLLFQSAKLRLTTPEAYRVHRDVIEWHARFSTDRIPDQALGAGRLMLMLMRFAMQSWERVQFFNRFLAGTWMPRIQLDFAPALACAAHFLLEAREPPTSIDDHVRAGRAVQRLWLTATRLGLLLQPELTPLVFARYAGEQRPFSKVAGTLESARTVGTMLTRIMGDRALSQGVFMGRIGYGAQPTARSIRKERAELGRHAP